MKKVLLVAAVVFTAISCSKEVKNKVEVSDAMAVNTEVVTKGITVDVDNSTINWKGFKPTGEHFGTIGITEGAIKLKKDKLVGGSFTFDMNTIACSDMPAGEYNDKLVGHLKSADFFDVEKFPTAKFEITDVKESGDKLSVSGNLTIKETTKNITIPASLSTEGDLAVLTSEVFTVDRAAFNVKYGSKSFFDDLKDKFINDEFEISFVVKTKK